MTPKSYKEIMDEMFGSFADKTKVEDLNMASAIEALSKSIEASLFYGCPQHEIGVRELLGKLGVKSARTAMGSLMQGAALQIESLEATLKQVTFDGTKIK